MNKVILMGRLTRDPEVRYSQGAEPMAIARYTLAVNRRFKRQGEPEADFIPCLAFRKNAEFSEKYFKKGQQVGVIGRLQVRNWEDKEGHKRTTTEVVIEDQYFAESKASGNTAKKSDTDDGFYPVDDVIDDDLPF
ncbi:MAG: single-stranded DNA-binding protein [Eubacteriales bacterium]|nr:single-stranded DNA-binding protein [Eubacteriales bacterium]